jgi:hypothetical protein
VTLSGPNSEALKVGSQTLVALGSEFDWGGAGQIVACPPLDSEPGFQGLQMDYSGLRRANGTPFPPVGSSQLIFAPESNFVIANGWLNDGGVLFNASGVCWPKLDKVNLYVSQAEQQLVSFQSDLSKLYGYLDAPFPDYISSYWPYELENLYTQANQLGVATSRLKRARRLATWNAAQACRFLANEIRVAITEKIAHLRRRLRIAKALKSKLLRLVASVYRFRNQIVLQRRYYLAHGSHPIVNSTCQETRRSLDQRGCVPAFQQ